MGPDGGRVGRAAGARPRGCARLCGSCVGALPPALRDAPEPLPGRTSAGRRRTERGCGSGPADGCRRRQGMRDRAVQGHAGPSRGFLFATGDNPYPRWHGNTAHGKGDARPSRPRPRPPLPPTDPRGVRSRRAPAVSSRVLPAPPPRAPRPPRARSRSACSSPSPPAATATRRHRPPARPEHHGDEHAPRACHPLGPARRRPAPRPPATYRRHRPPRSRTASAASCVDRTVARDDHRPAGRAALHDRCQQQRHDHRGGHRRHAGEGRLGVPEGPHERRNGGGEVADRPGALARARPCAAPGWGCSSPPTRRAARSRCSTGRASAPSRAR